jgi:hypothetical protein
LGLLRNKATISNPTRIAKKPTMAAAPGVTSLRIIKSCPPTFTLNSAWGVAVGVKVGVGLGPSVGVRVSVGVGVSVAVGQTRITVTTTCIGVGVGSCAKTPRGRARKAKRVKVINHLIKHIILIER